MAQSGEKTASLEELFQRDAFKPLPLTLSARLASGHAPLQDLRLLEPGGLVSLETPVGDPSELIAEGRAIGAGEIVEIKGTLAFRITRLGK